MKRAFLDTSCLLALVLRKDAHHAVAVQTQAEFSGSLVKTEYVLVEFHDALSDAASRSLAVAATDRLTTNPDVLVIPSSPALFNLGRDLFRARLDKNGSLTDCISFVVMRDQGLKEAMTADHQFEQAGFTALLK